MSVRLAEAGGIHVHRRQAVQCGEIISHLGVVAPQELVRTGCHVDVEGFPFDPLAVEELVHRLIGWRASEVNPHDVE